MGFIFSKVKSPEVPRFRDVFKVQRFVYGTNRSLHGQQIQKPGGSASSAAGDHNGFQIVGGRIHGISEGKSWGKERDLDSEKPRNGYSEIGKQVTVSTFGDQIACFEHYRFQDCKSILV